MAGLLKFNNLSFENIAGTNPVESQISGLICDGYETVFDRRISPDDADTVQVRLTTYLSAHVDVNTPSTGEQSQINKFLEVTTLSSISVNLGSVDNSATTGIGPENAAKIATQYFPPHTSTWKVEALRMSHNNNNTSRISYSLTDFDDWADE